MAATAHHVRECYKVAVAFDTVNNDIFMVRLARVVKDERLLWYICQTFMAGIMDNGDVCQKRELGTPQGGPLSPLQANILLDERDRELKRRRLSFWRSADDCIIFAITMEAGRRVLEAITRCIGRG